MITLSPGDIIATGTPGGVGHARTPPRYLSEGAVLTTRIEGIGECRNVLPNREDMTARANVASQTPRIGLMRDGESFLDTQLADTPLQQPSLLPGWTQAHIAAHLVGNARGLLNLLRWASTGHETPMYPNVEARNRDIDEWARQPDAQLKAMVSHSAEAFYAAAAALPAQAWTTTVRTALGREIPAAEVIWLRTRETWIHAIDLATGAWFDALPGPLIDALLTDVCATLSTRQGYPAVRLTPEDRVEPGRPALPTSRPPPSKEQPQKCSPGSPDGSADSVPP